MIDLNPAILVITFNVISQNEAHKETISGEESFLFFILYFPLDFAHFLCVYSIVLMSN